MDEMELPIVKEAGAQPFSLLGEAAALGETPVLPGRMVGTAHFQHLWCCMQLGSNWSGGGMTLALCLGADSAGADSVNY